MSDSASSRPPHDAPAVVFDFDGVLVDSEPLHYQAFVLIARSLGIDLSFEQYVQTYIGFDDRDAFRVMLEVVGKPRDPAAVGELCARKQPLFDTLAKARAQSPGGLAIPGALALVDRVREAGFRTAIASGATRADIDLLLGLLGAADRFELAVTADDVAKSKPDPQSYANAVAQLGVAPERAVAIEDTAAGLRSARAAGLATVAVCTSHRARELAGLADRVVLGPGDIDVDTLVGLTAGVAAPEA